MKDEIIPQQADLVWIRYKHKHKLVFFIGNNLGNYMILESDLITDKETGQIRKHIEDLRTMPLDELVDWLKRFCPTALRRAYRTLKASETECLRIYNIKKPT